MGGSPSRWMVTAPLSPPGGALSQSTLTHRRTSFSTDPRVVLSTIQGALAVAVNAKGARPRLNTSMKCRGWLYAPKTGSTAGAAPPGHATLEPSTATPIDAAAGRVSSATGGVVFFGGSCQYVYPMCV